MCGDEEPRLSRQQRRAAAREKAAQLLLDESKDKALEKPPEAQLQVIRKWSIGLGLPALAAGLGMTLTGYTNFWIGIGIAAIAMAVLTVEWYSVSRQFRWWYQVIGYTVVVVVAAWLLYIIFRPIGINIAFLDIPNTFPDGTLVDGITWKKDYRELRLIIENNNDSDQFANVSFLIRTNITIAAMGFNARFGHCDAETTLYPAIRVSSPIMTRLAPGQEPISLPLSLTMGTTFKVFCDRIIGGEQAEIVLATVNSPTSPLPSHAEWAAINGSFDALGRSRTLHFSQCFVSQCQNVVFP
jgi:hypothetical protein